MASTIIPLSVVWMIVNAWWFHIRLKYIEASEKLKAANEKLKATSKKTLKIGVIILPASGEAFNAYI
jgi:uncharacterized membrane protein YciS (DUF1049 family)